MGRGSERHEIRQNGLAERIEALKVERAWSIGSAEYFRLSQQIGVLQRQLEALPPVSWSEPMPPVCCAVCGAGIVQPAGAGRPRVTCSDACRAKRSREQRRRWAHAG